MTRIALILNPVSGGGAGRKRGRTIVERLSALGTEATLYETTRAGEAHTLARAAVSLGHTTVVAAGGDGTIHDVANGLLEADVEQRCTLGVIPVGTGNDFVKVVPGTRSLADALRTVATGTPRPYDVGVARWQGRAEYFVNGMGTGIDVEVVRQLTRMPRLPGAARYLLALLRALVKFRPVALRAIVDGVLSERRLMIIAIGNGVCQGGGFYLAPNARPDDGQLDVTIVDRLNPAGIVRVLPKVLRGTLAGDPAVEMRRGRRIVLESTDGRPLFFHLDGELREPAALTRLEVEILPQRLSVLTGVTTS